MPGKYKTQKQFLKEAILQHGNRYNYSCVVYKDAHSKIEIICSEHGSFMQEPNEHLRGCGCPNCAIWSRRAHHPKLSFTELIEKFNQIHLNKYDYSESIYKNYREPIKIICPFHGSFMQTIKSHISGRGCRKCSLSYGEKKIMRFLESHNILYNSQKMFIKDPVAKTMRFDFYLPKLNTIIEYNGAQHYGSYEYFGGDKKYTIQIEKDNRKALFCASNNINYLVIPYWDYDNIEKILSVKLE